MSRTRARSSRTVPDPAGRTASTRYGLARVLSKRGLCSRTEAARWIVEGRVAVAGRVVRDPESPTTLDETITVDAANAGQTPRHYLMLHKPRGLVTTARDEQGRDTVYRCLDGSGLPWVAPVGRLDKASEGLLLLSNDPAWAARITDPLTGPHKAYHVQVDCVPDAALLASLQRGITIDGALLRAVSLRLLRVGEKNAWLEVVLDEGRNRHIRRLLAAFDVGVLRLVRIAIGELTLGTLAKGQWRVLTDDEVERFRG